MKVAQINTVDVQGGAARAAYRLHRGLIQAGHESVMLVGDKTSHDATVQRVTYEAVEPSFQATALYLIQNHYINDNRTSVSNTLFTFPYPGFELAQAIPPMGLDVLNLHWVAYFLSPVTIKALGDLGKPIVWTLHDMWPFTGGCHYSAGCDRYTSDCSACPQLADNPFDLTRSVLHDKLALFADLPLTMVSPSRWLADCARASKLFGHRRIEVIPNSLETDVFRPEDKAKAKAQTGGNPETLTLMFGAGSATERRKGFSHFVDALKQALTHPDFRAWAEQGKVEAVCVGQSSDELDTIPIPTRSLGFVESDEALAAMYAAADLFILPSLEDNLPNTVLEAMSCGTPVIAFDVGGVPDLVHEGSTGRLAPIGDSRALAGAILDALLNPDLRAEMGKTCRQVVEDQYAIAHQASNYLALYHDLLAK